MCMYTLCTVADSRDQNQRAESDTVPGVVHVVCKEKIASKIAPYSKGCFFLAEKTNAFYSICEINRTFLINLIHVL